MKRNIKPCLEHHLVGKLKQPNVVPASAWLASAEQHHESAQLIINHDPAGALLGDAQSVAVSSRMLTSSTWARAFWVKQRHGAAVNLAAKMIKIATASLAPPSDADQADEPST